MITNKYGIHTFSLKLQCKYSKIQNIIEQNECIRTSKGKLGLSPYYQITQFKDIGVEIQLGQSVSHPCWLILIINPSSLLTGTYKPTALFQADKESVQQAALSTVFPVKEENSRSAQAAMTKVYRNFVFSPFNLLLDGIYFSHHRKG